MIRNLTNNKREREKKKRKKKKEKKAAGISVESRLYRCNWRPSRCRRLVTHYKECSRREKLIAIHH